MSIDTMTSRQKDLLLLQLMYRVTPEQRRHLMREVPDAYNAYCGSRIAVVMLGEQELT